MAKPIKIVQVRFLASIPLGRAAEMFNTLRAESFIDSSAISLSFDADSRFLRITTLKQPFTNLVPIHNIGSIVIDES